MTQDNTALNPTTLMVVGKEGGILHWFEDVLAALPGDAPRFALNKFGLTGRLLKHMQGADSPRYQRRLADALAARIAQTRPDRILVTDLFYLSREVNDVLRQSGALTLQWVGDRFDERLAGNVGIGHFFFTDTGLVRDGVALGLDSHYLPLATHRPTVPLLPWEQRATELLMVGAPSPSRITLLETLRHPALVIGPKWPVLQNPQVRVVRKRLSLEEVRALYGRHRFVLNQMNAGNLVCGLPARCFDATAHGACLLTDAVADLPLNFAPGREVLVYAGAEELDALLRGAGEVGEEVALAGQQRSLEGHLFRHRLAAMREVTGYRSP